MMILTLDNLAHRYNVLPSEALSRATTFDLMVLDVSTRYAIRQRNIAEGVPTTSAQPTLSNDEMLAMIKKVRKK